MAIKQTIKSNDKSYKKSMTATYKDIFKDIYNLDQKTINYTSKIIKKNLREMKVSLTASHADLTLKDTLYFQSKHMLIVGIAYIHCAFRIALLMIMAQDSIASVTHANASNMPFPCLSHEI